MSVGPLEISEYIDDEDFDCLEGGLTSDAIENGAPPYIEKPLSILQRDENGKLIAGLTASSVWDWLYIDLLWVDAAHRGQGLGKDLLLAAEQEAVSRGCHSVHLWTQSFQGTEFYPKCGYKKFVVMDDFPVGHQRIGFMKRLAT